MIPAANSNIITADAERLTSRTYALDIDSGRIRGMTDGREALKQVIYLILNTERYAHLIYSWNYGSETNDLIGQPKDYALPEIKRLITEALLQDDRILSVEKFEFSTKKFEVLVTFTVNTIYGEIDSKVVLDV